MIGSTELSNFYYRPLSHVNKLFIQQIIPVDRRAVNILLIVDFYYFKGNTLNYILVPHLQYLHTLCSSLLRDRSSRAIATLLGPGLFFLCTNTVGTVSSFTSRLSPNPSNQCSRSTVTWCWQTIFRLKLNLSTTWPAPILWTHFIANLRFSWNFWHLGKSFSFPWPFSCSVFRLHDIQTFYFHKTHKKASIMSLC